MNEQSLILSATQAWLEKAVIGLNLCPFAKAVHIKKQIRYTISAADNVRDLHADLLKEIEFLLEADPEKVETTLLIHPQVLNDFLDFNDFLDVADALLVDLNADGILQIASFHPNYQFFGTESDDIENYTNRAPYPTLHLIRESSIERAIASYPDTDEIYQKNIDTLKRLGLAGWQNLFK
ncbi:hypothetical protein AAKU67_000257 [Oxalobacteraceae bacterium GrIS 2.11]